MSDIAALNQTLYSLIATVNRDEINLAAYQREVDTMYLLICGALVVFSTYTHTHTHTPQNSRGVHKHIQQCKQDLR